MRRSFLTLTWWRERMHSSAPFKTIVTCKIMFLITWSQLLQMVKQRHNNNNNKKIKKYFAWSMWLWGAGTKTVSGKVQYATEVEQSHSQNWVVRQHARGSAVLGIHQWNQAQLAASELKTGRSGGQTKNLWVAKVNSWTRVSPTNNTGWHRIGVSVRVTVFLLSAAIRCRWWCRCCFQAASETERQIKAAMFD